MYKWILAVAALVAFALADPARAIVQESNTTVSQTGAEIKTATITITPKTADNKPAGKPTTISSTTRQSKPARVKVDDKTAKTIEVKISGRAEPVLIPIETWLRGGRIDLGGGLTLENAPATARGPSTPSTALSTPATQPANDYWTSSLRYAGEFGGFRIAADVGLTGGANFNSSGGSFIRGVDNFGGNNLVDQRSVDLGNNTGFVGGQLNVWQVSPGPRLFLQTGVNVPLGSSNSATQTGINTIPQGDATLKVDYDWQIPLFLGMSFPMGQFGQMIPLQDPRIRFGVGGIFTHGTISISGVDGPARMPFSASKSFTEFDPGFLVGLRGGLGGGWILGADLTVTWRDDQSITAGSASFPGTQSYTGSVGDGTDLGLMFSVSRTIGDSAMDRPFVAGSDIRLKRDIAPLGKRADGIALYRYRYLWSDTEYVGVMAQEIAETRPDAVLRGADGFLRVDYGKLGTRLMTFGEWSSRQMRLGAHAGQFAQ
jgi:hypothetical protein